MKSKKSIDVKNFTNDYSIILVLAREPFIRLQKDRSRKKTINNFPNIMKQENPYSKDLL